MCTEDVYTDIYADGRRVEHVRPTFCSRSRYGQLCDSPVVYKHPSRVMQAGDQPAKFLYPTMLPPTPRQTPRSTTPVYRSGDESDRSHHSSGSAAGRRRASAVYVNGQKVMDLGSGHRKRDSRTERIVIVDGPPTQRTPPQQYTMPYTAPPSPNAGVAGPFPYNIVEPLSHHRRESASGGLRPVIVDERPRPHVSIEVVNHHDRRRAQPQPQPPHRSAHRRHPSDDSRHSRSSSSAESDEERRARRHRERADRERAEEEVRRQKLRARIAAANAEINRRPPVPIRNRAPTAPVPHAAAPYVRPAVEVAMPGGAADRDRELVEAVRQLDISNRRLAAEKERRERERAERDEEEAQRARLKERMQPRRRATVGPGSRRHRVLYDDGIYRWE